MKNIMKNIFRTLKESHTKNVAKLINRRAKEMYQIKERDGEIWLTYEGCYVCPCSMLKEEPVDAICKLRDIFICHAIKTNEQ